MVFTRTSCAVRTTKSGILFSIPLFFLRRVCYNGASIMKKVHSAGFRPVTFVHFCHHTPQGDVGPNHCGLCPPDAPYGNHTPQGDVGFCHLPPTCNVRLQSHPARGRRMRQYLAEVDDLNMISHPARGRRIRRKRNAAARTAGYHTPQGDVGNYMTNPPILILDEDHTPQGDVGFCKMLLKLG